MRELGRIGQLGKQRLDAHLDTAAVVGKMTELVRLRERKGYRLVA